MAAPVFFKHKGSELYATVDALNKLSTERAADMTSRVMNEVAEGVQLTKHERKSLAKKFERKDVQVVMDGLSYVVERFGYFSASQEQVQTELESLGVVDAALEGILDAWRQNSKRFFSQLRAHDLGGPSVLKNVTYDTQLRMLSDDAQPEHTPNTVLQLHMNGDGLDGGEEKLTLGFDHAQLYSFFQQIDSIQHAIDGMTAKKGKE
eukprot:TRINITY_DN11771_c0_g1_i1.p1 TRINITY_DN11771_c0_g1~~TRINITY_DN11771_c0_g1_i1.p1  ORF type:complete len:206 (+),score=66.08 TRINITY_DN11771_c0_g1_i1:79-696(+)